MSSKNFSKRFIAKLHVGDRFRKIAVALRIAVVYFRHSRILIDAESICFHICVSAKSLPDNRCPQWYSTLNPMRSRHYRSNWLWHSSALGDILNISSTKAPRKKSINENISATCFWLSHTVQHVNARKECWSEAAAFMTRRWRQSSPFSS